MLAHVGCLTFIAATTANPSPGFSIFKSEMRTSYLVRSICKCGALKYKVAETYARTNDLAQTAAHVERRGFKLFEARREKDLEGIVAKHRLAQTWVASKTVLPLKLCFPDDRGGRS